MQNKEILLDIVWKNKILSLSAKSMARVEKE